jgi:3'-phosphoadenosine 5'-phosphosulfate sulfotransferase (PAPS reductase)/FAD synthetase
VDGQPGLGVPSEEDIQRISQLRPRTVLYFFSGGKDSSLALLLTRDFMKDFCERNGCKVYLFYIYITGNTHPLNAYAAYATMLWHKEHYGFEVMAGAKDRPFQEYMVKYGLEIGPRRWCYLEFKHRVIAERERLLPRPILEIDGMSPGDNRWRAALIKEGVEEHEREGLKVYAWHPLFRLRLGREEKLRLLEQHEEFKPIVELYRRFGDSMNCVVCPYKGAPKYAKLNAVENMYAVWAFTDKALKSSRWKHVFAPARATTLLDYTCDGACEF